MKGTTLVTGAAGSIGSATTRLFHDSGWEVLGIDIASNTDAPLDGLVFRTADATDETDLAKALTALSDMPPLRHVIVVAGGALPEEPRTQHDPASLELSSFRESLERNLTSQFATVKATLPWLRADAGSDRTILLTSSFNALSPEGMPGYSAAKAGLIGMMRAMVRPLGAEGIRINVVAPGTIRTPRTEEIWSDVPDHFDRLESRAALGRIGTPHDVASVFYALSVDMTHVTGQTLVVDGGQSGSLLF